MTTPIDELAEMLDTMQPQSLPEYPADPAEAYRVGFGHAVDRVLDFLDAARSTPVPASNVSEGLREALRIIDSIEVNTQTDSAADVLDRCHNALIAALAHAAPERLDVERLARALDAEWMDRQANPPHWDDDTDVWAERAKGIAAKYARLTQPDATEEAGPTLTFADQHPGLRSGDLHHGLRYDDGDPDA